MDYTKRPRYHYKPHHGWVNDPNGLVWFNGYYHVFYQHAPDYEHPWMQAMHWGHARTKDFLHWEELPVALFPDQPYDKDGCWSGTAIVHEDKLYLFYASIDKSRTPEKSSQTVSVAVSTDGIRFEKYAQNPVINDFPTDGCPDFRDPAVTCVDGTFYCVMASGSMDHSAARLLLYKSPDLLNWEYVGILCQWDGYVYAECPSFMPAGDRFLLSASVSREGEHFFSLMFGSFDGKTFVPETVGSVDVGPDQYAGQIFSDPLGRNILISWIPGWDYKSFAEHDVGCMSVPRQITCRDGKIRAYPVQELQHLLADGDPAVVRTPDGFTVARGGREPVIHTGGADSLAVLRDEHFLEIFVNGGELIYTVLL